MQVKTSGSLIDHLGSILLTADPSDIPTLGEALGALDQLEADLSGNRPIQSLLQNFRALLNSIILGESAAPAEDLNRLLEILTAIQTAAGKNPPVDSPKATVSPSTPQEFALPEWVEEKTFLDFMKSQKLNLEEIEGLILSLEQGDAEPIAEFRRRMHTLKGEAGVIGLDDLASVCHAVEDLLAESPLSAEIIDRLLQTKDWISKSFDNYLQFRQPEPPAATIVARLKSTPPEPEPAAIIPPATAPADSSDNSPVELTLPEDSENLAMLGEFLAESEDGLSQADQTLLRIESDGPDPEKINLLFRIFHSLKGVAGFLGLHAVEGLAHKTETMLNKVRQSEITLENEVLDLVFDATAMMRELMRLIKACLQECKSCVLGPEDYSLLIGKLETVAEGSAAAPAILPAAEPGSRIGEILRQEPFAVAPEAIEAALERQQETGNKLGEELIAEGAATPKQVAQALRTQNQAEATAKTGKLRETIKVDIERVENLMEMVGELVIVESMVVHDPDLRDLRSERITKHLSQLTKITKDLQTITMSMRMVPVRDVFQKMARLVRDLSRKNGKNVALELRGEATEMDRSMVEKISDPLVHMIRNAVDHGLESVVERQAAGKDPQGRVVLAAYHEGGNIVIEIGDDGRGLNKEAILQKALKQGLVRAGDNLADHDIYNLIFLPGFSTAQQVTAISGRGVGMDVVKRNLEAMRGRINIVSTPGRGTTFKMILPLTLAIIDGMLITCGPEEYIIPTLSIIESIQPSRDMLSTLYGRMEFINLRDSIMPLVRVSDLFHIGAAKKDPTEALIVIVESMDRRLGLMIDDVLTQQQVVIKNLASSMGDSKYFSGAAILSDGRVGLILNIDEIGRMAAEKRRGASREYQTTWN
ncbi:MAG: chemotaxis protein CheA [Myxococcales bacterium]|nr:chemotaxis protein CheA [Myxococcales bacterium]